MRGVSNNEQFRLMKAGGHTVRAVVPLPWVPPLIPRPGWRAQRAIPLVESDDGTEIAHPRYLSLGSTAKRFPVTVGVQRRLFWKGLQPSVSSFVANGGQIIHGHSAGLPGCMAGRTGSAKLVISILDDELFDIAPASPPQRKVIVDTLQRADAVVYLSPLLMRLGLKAAGPHNACVIPLAIDVYDDLRPHRPASFTISTAARLIERKKIHVLIEAFAAFSAGVPEARLVVMGDGTERSRLEKLAVQLGIGQAVQFTGHLTHREVVSRIAESHLFILPSIRESLGTVYFEAMSQGVPTVGTLEEGIADFIVDGEDGFLVRPDDPKPLVQLMRALHGSPELWGRVSAAGRASFERIGARWTDSVSAHLALFERLIRTERPQ